MQKGNLFTDKRSLVIPLTAFILVAIDVITKQWIRSYPQSQLIQQIGFLQIIHLQNTGAAFGLFQGHSLILAILAVIEIAVILIIAWYVYRRFSYLITVWNLIAVGLIIGGAIGNLIDRIRFNGSVTDFLDVGFWPAFNTADSGVTIGTIMLAITILRLAVKEKR
jgi:signal peptidase II